MRFGVGRREFERKFQLRERFICSAGLAERFPQVPVCACEPRHLFDRCLRVLDGFLQTSFAQKDGAKPALPPAPAEKMAPPIPEKK